MIIDLQYSITTTDLLKNFEMISEVSYGGLGTNKEVHVSIVRLQTKSNFFYVLSLTNLDVFDMGQTRVKKGRKVVLKSCHLK